MPVSTLPFFCFRIGIVKTVSVLAAVLLTTTPTHAQAGWLDEPLSNWNQPGMAIPAAIPGDFENLRCSANGRWPETPQDQAVVDAGWQLFNTYTAGWGLVVLSGTSGYDGMCRPMGYQTFVFVDGAFAGTISPEPMSSRASGAGNVISVRPDAVTARFLRYADTDPLCCPSLGAVIVEERIDRTPPGPVLLPVNKVEEPK